MLHIKNAVNDLCTKHNTRCPYKLAEQLGIEIFEYPFQKIRGLFFHLEDRKIIGIKADLQDDKKLEVIAHEIGHEQLHPTNAGYFLTKESCRPGQEKCEQEANLFAAALMAHNAPGVNESVGRYSFSNTALSNLGKNSWAEDDDGFL